MAATRACSCDGDGDGDGFSASESVISMTSAAAALVATCALVACGDDGSSALNSISR
jgi:tellurite resistance protein